MFNRTVCHIQTLVVGGHDVGDCISGGSIRRHCGALHSQDVVPEVLEMEQG